jgi:hypothetical protein
MEAIRRVYDLDTDPAAIALAARRFSPQAFAARLNGVIESRLAQRQAPAAARFARRIPVAA